jgi:hypothetical protein
MSLSRTAVQSYAKTHWNTPCDDGRIATNSGHVSVAAKAAQWGATGPDWSPVFVRDTTGETLWFTHPSKPAIEAKDLNGDVLDDCTHYISRCLIKGGLNVLETAWTPTMVANLRARSDTKTLAEKVPVDRATRVMQTGMMKVGDVIAYFKYGLYAHMGIRVETNGMSCHTWSRYDSMVPGDDWKLDHEHYLYTLIHFSSDDSPPSTLGEISRGWWEATSATGQWFYYLRPDGSCVWRPTKPSGSAVPGRDHAREGYWFERGAELLIFWTSTGSVEIYGFHALRSDYEGVWQFGSLVTPMTIAKLI